MGIDKELLDKLLGDYTGPEDPWAVLAKGEPYRPAGLTTGITA